MPLTRQAGAAERMDYRPTPPPTGPAMNEAGPSAEAGKGRAPLWLDPDDLRRPATHRRLAFLRGKSGVGNGIGRLGHPLELVLVIVGGW